MTIRCNMRHLTLSLLAWNLISMKAGAQESANQCVNEITSMEEIDDVMEATTEMLDAFNETCSGNGKCTADATAGVSTTKNDFTSLTMGNSLSRMEDTCNSILPGSTICLVTNEIFKGGIKTVEVNKPVCFPSSCDHTIDENVRFLDPNPAGCDPSSTFDPCEVTSTFVTCPPSRIEEFDSEICQSNAESIATNGGLEPYTNALRSAVIRACISVLLGGDSELCDINTPLIVSGTKDFSDFNTTTSEKYRIYEEKCKSMEQPGLPCRISAHISAIESDSFIDIETDLMYTELPLCVPAGCTDDPATLTYEQLVKDNFKCDSITSFCSVEISDFSCPSDEIPVISLSESSLTSKPSLEFSPSPSSFPTTMISSIPTIIDSSNPTTIDSSNPTITGSMNPTITESMEPSVSNTYSLTGSPTRSPTIAPTRSPTVSPTAALSQQPSIEPHKSIATFPPTRVDTEIPSSVKTSQPTIVDISQPTVKPTSTPTSTPTPKPTAAVSTSFDLAVTSGTGFTKVRWIQNKTAFIIFTLSSLFIAL